MAAEGTRLPILLDGRPVRVPISGVARYCLSLAAALRRASDVDGLGGVPCPEVLVQRDGGRNPTLGAFDPALVQVELTQFGQRRKYQNIATEFAPRLSAMAALRRYDLVHETYFANLGSAKVQRKVATIHDVIPLDHPAYFNRMNRIFSRRNFARQTTEPDAVIAVSEFTKQRILALSRYPEERIHVIGCGVDLGDAAQARDAVWPIAGKLAAGRDYCVYVGNIEPRKNLATLVDAWAALPAAHRDVALVVAGRFNYQAAAVIARAQDLLGDRFVYVGPVSEADKWGLIAAARALILPSLYEGYGIPIIEAYAAGTLALFSRNSSMTELAFDDRQMFDPQSVGDIATVVAAALDDPAWAARVNAQAAAWVTRQSWDAVAHATADVYRAVLAR